MPSGDLWLDWTLRGSVEDIRRLLPAVLAEYRVEEQSTAATGPGWATFNIGPLGVARAQDVGDGQSQLFLTGAASAELNRAGVLLYVELVRRGLLAPPPPLERLSAG